MKPNVTCVKEGTVIDLCLNCIMFLCEHSHKKYESHNFTELVELQSKKKLVDVQPKAKSMLCLDQHDLEMNFFCETCNQFVYHYCSYYRSAHWTCAQFCESDGKETQWR